MIFSLISYISEMFDICKRPCHIPCIIHRKCIIKTWLLNAQSESDSETCLQRWCNQGKVIDCIWDKHTCRHNRAYSIYTCSHSTVNEWLHFVVKNLMGNSALKYVEAHWAHSWLKHIPPQSLFLHQQASKIQHKEETRQTAPTNQQTGIQIYQRIFFKIGIHSHLLCSTTETKFEKYSHRFGLILDMGQSMLLQSWLVL